MWVPYGKMRCGECGSESTIMQVGNGCHSCLQGIMEEVSFEGRRGNNYDIN